MLKLKWRAYSDYFASNVEVYEWPELGTHVVCVLEGPDRGRVSTDFDIRKLTDYRVPECDRGSTSYEEMVREFQSTPALSIEPTHLLACEPPNPLADLLRGVPGGSVVTLTVETPREPHQ